MSEGAAVAYALHINREKPISLSEWKEAVSRTQGVRLEADGVNAINPKTGETISIAGNPGDVAVLFSTKKWLGLGKEEQWQICIRFFEGRATFKATEDIESPKNPVHVAAATLAKELGAQINGDEGETYSW